MSEYDEYLEENPDVAAQVEAASADEELPPDPGVLVTKNAYGPGVHSLKFADGKPVGVWVREQNMTPEAVEAFLVQNGVEADIAQQFARRREEGIKADAEIAADPVVQAFAAEEDRRFTEKKATQEAFLAAYRKKLKEK